MHYYDEPKIDCHCHVLDPARFAYAADVAYRPAGGEIGTLDQLLQLMPAYGLRHALLVGPNSGYGEDNRCLLDAIAQGQGRFKGIVVVPNDAGTDTLQQLKAAGVVGVAFNAALHGTAHYSGTAGLLRRLADLDMFINVQVERNQLPDLAPMLQDSGARILIDHCGRPDPAAGLAQPGFRALLALARGGRCAVKLSGLQKFSHLPSPWPDTYPYVQALLDAFTPDACLWASDWPFLRAPQRLDIGPLLQLIAQFVPDPADRRKVLWHTPCRWFGF